MLYKDSLRTEHWELKKLETLERSGHKCQICGKTERLEVHHNTYENKGNERPEDLIVLCKKCHKINHKNIVHKRNISEFVSSIFEDLEESYQYHKSEYNTKFLHIDDMLSIDRKDLILISGATSIGKTAFLLNIALNNYKENNIPIFGSIGITDWHERRADRRPMLQDIIDGEVIKYIADKIMFIYRDDYYNEESEFKGLCEIIIPKNNNGPIGTVKLNFIEELNKFTDYIQLID